MAKEYIERGALLEEVDEKISNIQFTSPYQDEIDIMVSGMERIRDSIEFADAADVVEVRHGEWILMRTEMFIDGSYGSKFCCSLCSREIGVCHEHNSDKYRYAKTMYPYCHCGAKMDLKEGTK